MVEAQAYYDQYLRTILDRLGLKASDRIGGPTVPGIMSQLIELVVLLKCLSVEPH